MNHISKKLQLFLLIFIASFCTSCATSVGLAAAAVTSATISVGTTIVTAPFKLIGAMGDDDNQDGGDRSNRNEEENTN